MLLGCRHADAMATAEVIARHDCFTANIDDIACQSAPPMLSI